MIQVRNSPQVSRTRLQRDYDTASRGIATSDPKRTHSGFADGESLRKKQAAHFLSLRRTSTPYGRKTEGPMAQLEKKWGIEPCNFKGGCPLLPSPIPVDHLYHPSVCNGRVCIQPQRFVAFSRSDFNRSQPPPKVEGTKSIRIVRILRGTSVAEGTSITHIELAPSWEGGPTWSPAEKRRDGPVSLVRAATAP